MGDIATAAPVWGPEAKKAAIAVTFDHLGEAADLQSGRLPADTVVGDHSSVYRDLPNVLDLLRSRGLQTTFYVEAWNTQLYPRAMHSILEECHEIGWHAWWNEPIYRLDDKGLAESLDRSLSAFDRFGYRPTDARPPGGRLGLHKLDTLTRAGFTTLSLAGDIVSFSDAVPVIPFAWKGVDAGYYLPDFTALRGATDNSVVGPQHLLKSFLDQADKVAESGQAATFVFHVTLADDPQRLAVIGELIDRLAEDQRFWLASPKDIYAWIAKDPSFFPTHHVDTPIAW